MMDLKESHLSLRDALEKANDGETILLEDKTYFEKIELNKKNITLIGQPNTKITFDAHAGMIIPLSLGGDGVKKFTTTTSATFRVKEGADGFKAFGITFENAHKVGSDLEGAQAVAFKSEINDLTIDNCRFLGAQDTLYIDLGKNNTISSSYIEGDIDFIFGSADCTFNNCEIVGLNKDKVYFTAPSTYFDNKKGFHFKYCKFKTEAPKSYLGRCWFPGGAKKAVYPRLILKSCELSGNIELDLIAMKPTDERIYELRIKNSLHNNLLVNLDLVKYMKG